MRPAGNPLVRSPLQAKRMRRCRLAHKPRAREARACRKCTQAMSASATSGLMPSSGQTCSCRCSTTAAELPFASPACVQASSTGKVAGSAAGCQASACPHSLEHMPTEDPRCVVISNRLASAQSRKLSTSKSSATELSAAGWTTLEGNAAAHLKDAAEEQLAEADPQAPRVRPPRAAHQARACFHGHTNCLTARPPETS